MGRGLLTECPCGACECIAYTDSWKVIGIVWFHTDKVIAWWDEDDGASPDGECPECHAILDPKDGTARTETRL